MWSESISDPSLSGRRDTRTGRAIRQALTDLDRAVSAQELYRLLHAQGHGIGLASIYRALDHLVAGGEAERIRRAAEDVYVLCPAAHHHHAICRNCGRVDVLSVCHLEGDNPPASEHGFRIDSHQAVYYGRCPGCIEREGSTRTV